MTEIKDKILYIDDERDNLTTFRATFRWEYDVLTAISAYEGLDILEKNEIYLIISDQRMPGLSGTEFFHSISNKYPNLTKVIMTGSSDSAVLQALDENIIHKCIPKPWEEEEVKQVLEEVFGTYTQPKQNHSYDNWL